MMKNTEILSAILSRTILSSAFLTTSAQAQIVSYCTYISRNDIFNTSGQRLRSVSQIIQQDRANLHKFNRGDANDGYENYFTTYNNRVALARAIENSNVGRVNMSRELHNNILNGNAYVCVDYYGEDSVNIYD
ncbi:MAG: hypothetical protein J7647_03275 [Cyanobacteria bacterium SBLK]|nr:hypothetical protein [Cyanobacteria bacterium SBLK]